MADPRFYRNRGPFALAALCEKAGLPLPSGADGGAKIADIAGLDGAAAEHLSFFTGGPGMAGAFTRTRAGFCLVPEKDRLPPAPGAVLIPAPSVQHAFAAIAALFYPEADRLGVAQPQAVDPGAKLGKGVQLAPGVVIAAGAEIGEGSVIGANSVIGPNVTIGKGCQIGSQVSISYAHIGDRVVIKPGVQIGQSGFGFASSSAGHVKIPQLGRVIIQDDVEIGAGSTVDRGALGDTVIGEGTKIDNLVQIAHNARTGRHCILVSQSGMAGSSVIEDFVVVGGQVGIADHAHVGAGARLAGRSACVSGQQVPGGQDYGGVPAKPIRDWLRELHAVSQLIRRRKD